MSKPLLVISTDIHIKESNTDKIIDLFSQQIILANSLGCNNLACLGDIVNSRQAQPLIILKTFEKILDMVHEAGMVLYTIPGNHCKVNYVSKDSYLDQFQWHPALSLFREYEDLDICEGVRLHFIPFFEENVWIEELKKVNLLKDGKNYLLSHQAFEGSVNNDGSKVSSPIKPSIVENFDKVFLGHYHNKSKVGRNIYHIPSIQANNFGEDNEKGFTVLYEDGSHELVQSKFEQYHTIVLDMDETTKEDLNDLAKQSVELMQEMSKEDGGAKVRFKLKGSPENLNAIKQEEFTSLGIDIKKDHKVIANSIEKAETGEVVVYTDKNILEKFNEFVKEEEYDNVEYGLNLLKKKLNENS